MLDRRKLFLVYLTLLAIHTACGNRASAPYRSSKSVATPNPPLFEDSVFSLNGKKIKTIYRGTLLVFNDSTSPEGLADVINSSVASRNAWAAMRRFENSNDYVNLYGDNGVSTKTLDLMRDDLFNFERQAREKNPIANQIKLENATNWLEKELELTDLTQNDLERFQNAWGGYCEAKVIELALQPNFSSSRHINLPSPNPMCIKYYSSRKMLEGPSCDNPQDNNYFRCIWQEGVLKTRWFVQNEDDPNKNPEELTKKAQWITQLLDTNQAALQETLSLNAKRVNTNLIRLDFFVRLGLSEAKKTGPNSSEVKRCTLGIKEPSLKGFCEIFGTDALKIHPRDFIEAMEGRSSEGELFKAPTPNYPRSVTIQQLIRFLSERRAATNSELDRLFHQTLGEQGYQRPTYGGDQEFLKHVPEFLEVLGPFFYGTLSPQDQSRISEKTRDFEYLKKKVLSTRSEWTALDKVITESSNQGFAAANAPDVSVGFLDIRLAFSQKGNVLRGKFWVNGFENRAYQGCYNVVQQSNAPCEREADQEDLDLNPALLTQVGSSGRINFTFRVRNAINSGFAQKERVDVNSGLKPDYFWELDPTRLEGHEIRIELTPNRLIGNLDILTGKALLETDENKSYEAGISTWEI